MLLQKPTELLYKLILRPNLKNLLCETVCFFVAVELYR